MSTKLVEDAVAVAVVCIVGAANAHIASATAAERTFKFMVAIFAIVVVEI